MYKMYWVWSVIFLVGLSVVAYRWFFYVNHEYHDVPHKNNDTKNIIKWFSVKCHIRAYIFVKLDFSKIYEFCELLKAYWKYYMKLNDGEIKLFTDLVKSFN